MKTLYLKFISYLRYQGLKLIARLKKNIKKVKVKKVKKERLIVGLLILAVICLALFDIEANSKYIGGLLDNVNISAKTTPYTELYFQDHIHLPSVVDPYKQYDFSFTIHNLENQDMNYPYVVYIDQGNNVKQVLDKNSISLRNKAYVTIQEGFVLNSLTKRMKIVVDLIDKNQQIAFWISPYVPLTVSPSNQNTAIVTPAPVVKKYGTLYWRPEVNKAQVWLGADKSGKEIWADKLPAPGQAKKK